MTAASIWKLALMVGDPTPLAVHLQQTHHAEAEMTKRTLLHRHGTPPTW
jgi:hypothetical protein